MHKSLLIAVIVLMQLVGLLLFQLLIIRFVGVGPETDAYVAAQAVPVALNAIVVSTLQSVWLPRLSLQGRDVSAWHQEKSLAQGQAAILGVTAGLLLMATVGWWVPLLYPGFSDPLCQTTIIFSFVLLAATVLNIQSALLTVTLRASDQFLTAEVIALVSTVMALLALLFLVPEWGIWSALWIFLVRAAVIYLLQMYVTGWPWPAIIGGLQLVATWNKSRPLLYSGILSKTAPLVDRFWASQAHSGSLTLLGLAQQGVGAVATVLERSISVPLIPTLSRLLERGDVREVKSSYRARVIMALLATLSIAGFLMVGRVELSEMFVRVLHLDADGAVLLWKLIVTLAGFLFVSIAGTVVISILYALGEMTLAAKISIGGFLLGLLLKWLFFETHGVVGLAVAITLAYLTTFVVGVVFVEMKLRDKELSRA